ncbi:MAG: 1-acyl-sn-glycerol-3-phosphate acyltransferase [Clostridiales bacterium]|nr:1-acyl-sn-glycerol-3-phosphate acyltransferase [Candidatus Cacconaster stercorequi]
MRNRFYEVMWVIFSPIFRLFHPLDVQGLENLPTDRPVLICVNHSHALDPILLAAAMPKTTMTQIMAKKQLFKIPVIGWLITKLGAFPVDRGHSDINAVKKSIQCLKDGCHLVIFPEGTRVSKPGQVSVKGGVAMIAIRSGVELLPVFIGMDKKAFHKVPIIFGKPYSPQYTGRRGTAEEYQANADEIMQQVYALGGVK